MLEDETAAMAHGILVMRELMHKRSGMAGEPWSAWTMRVSDEVGRTVHLIPFAEMPEGAVQ